MLQMNFPWAHQAFPLQGYTGSGLVRSCSIPPAKQSAKTIDTWILSQKPRLVQLLKQAPSLPCQSFGTDNSQCENNNEPKCGNGQTAARQWGLQSR